MIVYLDEAGKPPEFYAAGWHDRKNEIPADPQALFKIARYHKDIDTVVVQFVNTTNFSGNTWSIGEIVFSRTVKIMR